jgi:hypothetical protein
VREQAHQKTNKTITTKTISSSDFLLDFNSAGKHDGLPDGMDFFGETLFPKKIDLAAKGFPVKAIAPLAN